MIEAVFQYTAGMFFFNLDDLFDIGDCAPRRLFTEDMQSLPQTGYRDFSCQVIRKTDKQNVKRYLE